MANSLPTNVLPGCWNSGILQGKTACHKQKWSLATSFRSIIPAYRTSYAARWKAVMEGRDRQAEIDALVKFRYDEHARPLAPLPLGTHVRIWNPKSKLWDKTGVIVSVGRYRSYRVKFASVLWRNHHFLRPMIAATPANDDGAEDAGNRGAGASTADPDGKESDSVSIEHGRPR
jgi:hypothetical protein